MAAEQEYQVVARRYRPQRFDELIGQEHIAKALANAILNNRIGHAYLFTGARGVGKTSSARIFAKSLNCVEGPTSTPCNQCEICQGITQGEDLDVIEIDGASNRGIDQIRTLIQNVNVRPVRSRFKIFIIDEVHMLTNEAFNALLKTLEEPPEHVKFIFCTTEVNKIPITILSRCQRFDFAGIGTLAIADRLQMIVTNEGLTAEPEAIRLLARRANGSMRDGQSLLEQLLAFTSGEITLQDVHQLLGTANDEVLIEILRSIRRNEPAGILRTLDLMIQQGADPGQFLEQLFGCLRDMMAVLAGCGSESFLFLPSDIEEEAREMAQKMGLDLILAAMQIIDHTLTRMKVSTQGRLLAEMAFVRICSLQSLVSLQDVIAQTETREVYLPEPRVSFSDDSSRVDSKSTDGHFQTNSFTENSLNSQSSQRPRLSENPVSRMEEDQKVPLSPPPELRRSFVGELEENPAALKHALNKKKETVDESNLTSERSSFHVTQCSFENLENQKLGDGAPEETLSRGSERPISSNDFSDGTFAAENTSNPACLGVSISQPSVGTSEIDADTRHLSSGFSSEQGALGYSSAEKSESISGQDSSARENQAEASPHPQVSSRNSPRGYSNSDDLKHAVLSSEHLENIESGASETIPGDIFTVYHSPVSGSQSSKDGERLLETFLEQLNHFPNNPTADSLTEIKNLAWSSDGKHLIVTCPQRCEFALQQFQKDPQMGKELEKLLAGAFNRPGLTLKFTIERAEVSVCQEVSSPGLRQLYENPLVQAAESLFEATILKIENME